MLETQETAYLEDGLWDEDGEWVWLLADRYRTGAQAKYAAWVGRSLPTGFREMGVELTEMTCKVTYARPGEPHESGWAGSGEEMFWRCDSNHPKAIKFYEIGAK